MSKTILVVDDEDLLRKMLVVKLRSEGYECTEARNGLECAERVDEKRPDLILLDLMLPRRDGIQAYELLQAQKETKKIPVVVISARDEPTEAERKRLDGIAEYLVKPVSLDRLMQVVTRVLDA